MRISCSARVRSQLAKARERIDRHGGRRSSLDTPIGPMPMGRAEWPAAHLSGWPAASRPGHPGGLNREISGTAPPDPGSIRPRLIGDSGTFALVVALGHVMATSRYGGCAR